MSEVVKLKPCPRCKSPFVEVQPQGASSDSTLFACAVCGLAVPVPLPPATAVAMWNDWDRSDGGVEAQAKAMTQLADAHKFDAAGKATRLERIICAQVQTGRWPIPGMPPSTVEELARGIVGFARAIEAEMDRVS